MEIFLYIHTTGTAIGANALRELYTSEMFTTSLLINVMGLGSFFIIVSGNFVEVEKIWKKHGKT